MCDDDRDSGEIIDSMRTGSGGGGATVILINDELLMVAGGGGGLFASINQLSMSRAEGGRGDGTRPANSTGADVWIESTTTIDRLLIAGGGAGIDGNQSLAAGICPKGTVLRIDGGYGGGGAACGSGAGGGGGYYGK